MGKARLALCVGDETYQDRFAKCLMKHYKDQYELHLFHTLSELMGVDCGLYEGFILGECDFKEIGWPEDKCKKTLVLNEENKYQEVYKIIELLEPMLGDMKTRTPKNKESPNRVIGIYSFTVPHMQMPFAAMLSEICGEQEKAILIDFQENSGLNVLQEDGAPLLGLEDTMSIVTAGNYSRSRLLSAIGHKQGWDYVYPVKNSNCILEGLSTTGGQIVELLIQELGYKTVIINLGNSFATADKLMEACDELYLLYSKVDVGGWREKQFVDEMERRGRNEIFHRIKRIEISTVPGGDGSWERITEQWKWGGLGNSIRKMIWEAENSG